MGGVAIFFEIRTYAFSIFIPPFLKEATSLWLAGGFSEIPPAEDGGVGGIRGLAQTYINSGNYEQAGKTLENALGKYKNMTALTQLLPQIENIFVKELNRPEKAIEVYESIKEGTYDDRLKTFLDKKIDLLKKNSKKE